MVCIFIVAGKSSSVYKNKKLPQEKPTKHAKGEHFAAIRLKKILRNAFTRCVTILHSIYPENALNLLANFFFS